MSSSPHTDHWWRPRSLRSRLTITTVALVASVGLLLCAVTTLAVHTFLIDRVDDDLMTVTGFATSIGSEFPEASEHVEPGAPELARILRGQPLGSFAAFVDDGTVEAVLSTEGDVGPQARVLPTDSHTKIAAVPADGRPHDLDLASAGEFRVVASQLPGGEVVVTGLPTDDVQTTVNRLLIFEGLALALAVIVAAAAGGYLVDRSLRPLRRVSAAAREVSRTPLDRGEVALQTRVPDDDIDPASEVGQVATALNHMLGHVGSALQARHDSETRVRQFVADASHELRTPLASIRGYTELTRRTRSDLPPDVAHALSRVESEAGRMSTLVDDLLLLARLDSGRPLESADVDLTRLAIDAVSDAQAAGPEHKWRMRLPDEPVVVPGDGARLHQVLGNLLANARMHTPESTTITVAVTTGPDGGAVLSVHDDGPGIPEAEQHRVFERFARVDSSRARTSGSTGLGLAIVAAVVEALGGEVALRSRPGSTTFTITLPG